MTGKLLTIKEVAERLSVSEPTIYRLINRGELPTVKIGRALRFDEADIEAYIRKAKGEA